MPLFVGSGTTSGGGFEAQSSQSGIPTSTSDPQNANVGDVYVQRVGTGATMKLYDGVSWNQVGGAQNIVPSISGGDPYAPADGFYEIRVFTSPGTLTISSRDVDAEAIIIAGGGGGGTTPSTPNAGGGGAGGVIGTTITLSPGSYPIGVGTGGYGGHPSNNSGCPGGNTTFNGFTAIGGGGGGGNGPGAAGLPGGSGGGGGCGSAGPGGSGTFGQGFEGSPSSPTLSGGGGGYAGGPATPSNCGRCAGGAGMFEWALPTTVCGTSPQTGATLFAGGGSISCSCPPGGGFYGTGGYGGNPLSPTCRAIPGCDGAVFIRFKKCQ